MADRDIFGNEVEVTLDKIKDTHTFNLNIRSTYTQFGGREAFRERDEIIKTAHISAENFMNSISREVKTEGRRHEIFYKATAQVYGRTEVIGFIRYSGMDGRGTVELTNRKSTLQPWHLDMGGTSKRASTDQAGTHGEGMKLAALALLRPNVNHSIKCVSGGFTWTFFMNKLSKMCVRVQRLSGNVPSTPKSFADSVRMLSAYRKFEARPHEDVQFLIGAECGGANPLEQGLKRDPVTQACFEGWTDMALFLQAPAKDKTNSTTHGHLLLEARYQGKLYLKGLLLNHSVNQSASISGKRLKYGYNFAGGNTNRDRMHVATAKEEARTIADIWASSLQKDPKLIGDLSEMLLSETPMFADVNMANDMISSSVASLLLAHLRAKNPTKWFFPAKERQENPDLVKSIQGLGMEGMLLPLIYWDLLRIYSLVSTVKQEEERRFENTTIVRPHDLPKTYFAQETYRLIQGCLESFSECMEPLTLVIVRAGSLALDLTCKTTMLGDAESELKVHEKWFSHELMGAEFGIQFEDDSSRAVYSVVRNLFARILENLLKPIFDFDGKTHEWKIRQLLVQAEQRLHVVTAPAPILVSPDTGVSIGVTVNIPSFSWLPEGSSIEVQLHCVASCDHRRSAPRVSDASRRAHCIRNGGRCRVTTVRVPAQKVSFDNLEVEGKYFALVIDRSDPESFIHVSRNAGVPSGPVYVPPPKPPVVSYELGDRLNSLDLMQRREWFSARNVTHGRVVIGRLIEDSDDDERTGTQGNNGRTGKKRSAKENESATIRKRIKATR